MKKDMALVPRDLIAQLYELLNDDIACLPCSSRVRELDEETWETAMYLRDRIDNEVAWERPSAFEASDCEGI